MSDDLVKILDGNTFVVSDARGDIEASIDDPTGLFAWDTRFLSTWILTLNGQRLNTLSVDDLNYFETRFFLVPGTGTVYIDAKLSVIRRRAVGEGFSEELVILNHDSQPVELGVRIEAGSDFADLFEVKDALKKQGEYERRVEKGRLLLTYRRERFVRQTVITSSESAEIDENGITFRIRLDPKGEWRTTVDVVVAQAGLGQNADRTKVRRTGRQSAMERGLEDWISAAPRLECDWDWLKVTYARSLIDLAALRFSPRSLPGQSLPAAGLPWFMTMFGRDSIFTSLQALPFTPDLAATTLRALAQRQGTRIDDFREEEPGRILHEVRFGELTAFEERPHSPYFGAADATSLFVVLLDEYERWTGDRQLIRKMEPAARAAIDWIDRFGDRQGNGYVSYQRRNEQTGLENQCWKDSWDSIAHRDGTLPGFPRATCELQGYAYDAKIRAARLAREIWRDEAFADGLEREAAELKRRSRPRLLDFRRRLLRARARRRRASGRRALFQYRSPPVERDRRQGEGEELRRSPDESEALLGLGDPNHRRGRRTLQPDRLSRRDSVALRLLLHRLGPSGYRVRGRGRPCRGRNPGRRTVLPRPPAGGLRRVSAGRDQIPGSVPDVVQPTGVVDGRPAASSPNDARARAGRRPARRRPHPASGHWSQSSSSTSPVDGDAWTRSAGAVSTPHRPHGSAGSSAPSQNLRGVTLVAAEPNPAPIERLTS